jgi:NAD(P)-dependent dehydrogenase (short-subunit alcohol dehydrogenase family)
MCATRAGHRFLSVVSRDLFDLRDRVAIVTGSGRGLGKSMAAGLADAGASVVVCARHADEVEEAAAAINAAGGSAFPAQVDTSDRDSCRQLVETTVKALGRVDILVNNAGIDIIEPAEDVGEADWETVININLSGYFHCSQFAARQMLQQGSGGSIINNSSAVGIRGLTAYSAAKGGVNQLTRVMAVEWATRGIRVNAIAPGYFDNVMRDATDTHADPEKQRQVIEFTPMARRGRAEELVGPVVFLASDASSYVTGAVLFVDGGYTAM